MTARDPLIVTRDVELGEEVSRIAAAAGREPRRAAPEEVGEGWRTARLVLLDPRAAAECTGAAGLPRRTGTVLVSRDPEPDFWREAFRYGARHAVGLPADEQWLVELLAGRTEESAPGAGSVLAVLGGCGGAGASVFAALTAVLAAREGRRCMLLDCDPLGGGLDFALGEERAVGVRWSELSIGTGRVTADALREALPTRRFGSGALSLLCPGRSGQGEGITKRSVEAVVDAGARAGETVICDLPRTLDEPSAEVLCRADLTAVVIPAEVRACAAAGRLLASLRERTDAVRAVVRGPAPGGLEVADVRRSADVETVATMRADPRMAGLVDRFGLYALGAGMRGPSVRAARKVLDALAETRREAGDSDFR